MRRAHGEIREGAIERSEEILAAEGLEAVTARRVAGAIGVSVGTLYNVFGHLDGLVRAVNRRTMARLRGRLSDALVAEASSKAEDRLIALALAYFDFARENPALWDALFRHRMQTPPEVAVEEEFSEMTEILAEATGRQVPSEALLALWAATHGVVELTMTRRLPEASVADPRRFLEIIVRTGARGLAAERG
ncbi:MAG: WHG domain-containing protein [Pseudomonadota bacterium]